jgi:hypothetical protein
LNKRPPIDLMSLTAEQASPMPEATQRIPLKAAKHEPEITKPKLPVPVHPESSKTENLEALAFKVPRVFRKRFRQRAVAADLKLNELLFEALDAWEEKHGLKR